MVNAPRVSRATIAMMLILTCYGCSKLPPETQQQVGLVLFNVIQAYNYVFDPPNYCGLNLYRSVILFAPSVTEARKRFDGRDNKSAIQFAEFVQTGLDKMNVDGCPAALTSVYIVTVNTWRNMIADFKQWETYGFLSGKAERDVLQARHDAADHLEKFGDTLDTYWREYWHLPEPAPSA